MNKRTERQTPSWLDGVDPLAWRGCRPALWAVIEQAHATPGRHYHAWSHIEACLVQFRSLRFDQPRVVLMAVLLHDAVYDVGATDNEARSAQLAQQCLPSHTDMTVDEVAAVRQMILATAHHHGEPPTSADTRRFLDIDLSILGQPWSVYERYAQQVQREWCPAVVDEAAYRQGRQRFLAGMQAQPRIYFSQEMAGLEAQARANLARELSSLLS